MFFSHVIYNKNIQILTRQDILKFDTLSVNHAYAQEPESWWKTIREH